MPTPSYTITCTENTKIARDIYVLKFTKPADLTFIAGQYLLFDVPLIDHPEDIQTRAISIASTPEEPDLLFVMKMKEGGRASRWIMEKLKAGDSVRVQGPFGRFILNRESTKNWLLVCTSTGIAPFRSQLLSFLKDETRRIDLLFGVRSEEDIFWKDEFMALEKMYPNFSFHVTLSQPGTSWQGVKGRVQAALPQIIDDIAERQIYVCGSPAMTGEMKKLCMETYGMAKSDFHMEGYI